jgi:hypothetical protein
VGAGKTLSVTHYTVNDGNSGGNYIVTTVDNHTGVINSAVIDTVTGATPGANFSATDGASTGSVVVATFTGTSTGDPSSDFTVTIQWGDGKTDPAAVRFSNGVYLVTGSHTYTDEGTYFVTVVVTGGGTSAKLGTTATILAVLPDGTRGTPTQRFVAEAFGDLFGQLPSQPQLVKFTKKVKANHQKFVSTLLATGNFEHKFLTHEVSVLYTALVGSPPLPLQLKQAVASLVGGKSLAQVARKWHGVSAAAVDQLLVQALVEQFLDRSNSAGDLAQDARLVEHPGSLDHLAALLVGSPEYFAKTSR